MQPFVVTDEATVAPVTVEQLRNHLRLFGDTSQDTELATLILSAQRLLTDEIGEFISETLIRQPYTQFMNVMPITHQRVTAINSVMYYDSSNVLQRLNTTDYVVDLMGKDKRVLFNTIPSVEVSTLFPTPIYIDYSAGFENVPLNIEQAILTCAAEMHRYRYNSNDSRTFSNVINGSSLTEVFKRRLR